MSFTDEAPEVYSPMDKALGVCNIMLSYHSNTSKFSLRIYYLTSHESLGPVTDMGSILLSNPSIKQ